jgi:glycine/D-amino acid oxidase-like deaminating enzyme
MTVTSRELASLTPWQEGAPDPGPALAGEVSTDVCIIGAGYTGLSSALALKREGFDVVVLEADAIGFGASGRNAGHLTPTIGKDLPTLLKMYSLERVRALLHLQEMAISHVEGLIREHGIDCEYEATGTVVAAVHPRQHAAIDRAAEAAAKLGVPGELLDESGMDRRGLPRAFTRGYFEPHGGVLHPGRYVRGLGEAAKRAGARIFEGSRVTAIDEGPPAVVTTSGGKVRARYVVIGTNAYTPQLGRLKTAGTRIQVQLFKTEPLSRAQLEAVGWPGREGIYTAHELLESYRLTARNEIVGGSKHVRAGFGTRVLADVDETVASRIEAVFYERFPELKSVRIARRWGGPIFLCLDFLPVVGRSANCGSILHSVAYAGHGVALASYAGEMVADMVLERDGPGRVLWERWNVPTPPEPLRWLAFQAITRFLLAVDRRADASAPRRRFDGGGVGRA